MSQEVTVPQGRYEVSNGSLRDEPSREVYGKSTVSYRVHCERDFQFPPPPPKFSRKFGHFFRNSLGGSGQGSGFSPDRCFAQTLGARAGKGSEEVLSHEPTVALLDHLNGRTAVFREPLEIRSFR